MNSILNFFKSSNNVTLVDYLKQAIDEAKSRATPSEFNLALNFKDRFGNEDGTQYLVQTLQQCKTISKLTLELREDRIRDDKFAILLSHIGTMTQLKHFSLNVCKNSLTEISLAHIGDAIGKLTQLESLELNVSCLKIGDKKISVLTEALKKCTQLKKLIINMDYCNIEDAGLQALCTGLANCISLVSLQLHLGCNGFSQYPGQPLSQMIGDGIYKEYLKTLEDTLKLHNLTTFSANYW